VTITILALWIALMFILDVLILLNALQRIFVPFHLAAQLDNALTLQRTVMTEISVPLIPAIFALELACTLQLRALVVLEMLELAILKQLNVKSEKHVATTVIALLMEILLAFLFVLQSDAPISFAWLHKKYFFLL